MKNEQARILVVDDEAQITRVLRRSLSSHGYEVQVAEEGEEALKIFRQWKPDLVITDLAMPNMAGLELCRKLRAISRVPIIVLSVKGDERAKVEALDSGADDYVTKPFGMEELFARVRAALRRGTLPSTDDTTPIEVGVFNVDLATRSVRIQGNEVHLTPKEYDLVLYFIRNPGKVLTHRILLGAIWGGESVEQTEYLRVLVGQLRKKIEPDLEHPRYILTEPWIGYRFQPDGDE